MSSTEQIYSIAIDGPAGAGKSTLARKVAQILNIDYIDTGAMYRALTLRLLENKIEPSNHIEIIKTLKETKIDFHKGNIYLDNVNVNSAIRQNLVSKNVSYVAAIRDVREEMVGIQQEMSFSKSVVMDGRDIGTVVLPNANFKFYITASTLERAKRRYKELLNKGELNITLEEIQSEIQRRDYIDSNRKVGPLRQASDAYLIDTTYKTIDESVNIIVSRVLGGN